MEQFNYSFSLKNIPIPSREYYMQRMMAKTEEFVQRLRWKSFYYLNPSDKPTKRTFGFKTTRTAPQVKELQRFENDLYGIISDLEFTNFRSPFSRQLSKDVRRINSSRNIFLIADKTRNIYEVSVDTYNKLLSDNVTSKYKKSTAGCIAEVNSEAREIAARLEIDDRVECIAEENAFITIKDHKPNFKNNTKCRLINPAKSQIGKISKQLLDSINTAIRGDLGLRQWRSTQEVIHWFTDIEHKSRKRFMQLDICEFYPSISEELLSTALHFAGTIQAVRPLLTADNIEVIMHSRKSFLFTHDPSRPDASIPWTKKEGLFDVTMGAPDGAEICELVGLFLLNEIKHKFPELEFGLYRDDGLAIHRRIPGPRMERIKKDLVALFKSHGLAITIDTNLESTNFLDITLDLGSEKFKPYRKPNDQPLYVHTESNHPPTVIKQLPISINRRLSEISSTEDDFQAASPMYQTALNDSGYSHTLKYCKPSTVAALGQQKQRRVNKRRIIWFNPPFSKGVTTNLGKAFLALIRKHFPPGSPLYAVCNKNTIKLSYSCTRNMKAIIQAHNRKLLSQYTAAPPAVPKCNCRVTSSCPVQGNCQASGVYKATVRASNNKTATYIGCSNNFKKRYSAHKNSFRNEKYMNATALSSFLWENSLNHDPDIEWEIIRTAQPYRPGRGGYCQLCLQEKVHIIAHASNQDGLNKRTEVGQTCRHKARFKLANF